jgi:hypothetical protein
MDKLSTCRIRKRDHPKQMALYVLSLFEKLDIYRTTDNDIFLSYNPKPMAWTELEPARSDLLMITDIWQPFFTRNWTEQHMIDMAHCLHTIKMVISVKN